MTPTVVHLVVGPDQHGVVRHGRLIAEVGGDRLVRADHPADVEPAALAGADVVHVSFTDRLFAENCEASAAAFRSVADTINRVGAALSVTLHDLPVAGTPLGDRRCETYRRVVAGARGVVVNSLPELRLLDALGDTARSRRVIPLPLPTPSVEVPTTPPPWQQVSVAVLGFLFPDRGYEHTIDELPPGVDLFALGRPSLGHEDLPAALDERARSTGHRVNCTGFIADDDLAAVLFGAAVPVAPNRRVLASGSIASWLAHRRRPLVPDSEYTRGLARRWPDTLTLYDPDLPGDLRAAIRRAIRDPASTWLAAGVVAGPNLADVLTDYRAHFAGSAAERATEVGPDRWLLPGNRWDLLDGRRPSRPPTVSVVVPYFDGQSDLDLVLGSLAQQRYPRELLQVVVADDGSPIPPDVSAAGHLDVVVVRQPDEGFRAAAARNLGAHAADGAVLLFVDGDTVPEPDYVSRMSRLPALSPDVLTVGRRRHADLHGWTPDRLVRWLTDTAGESADDVDGPTELDEPTWLADGYRQSNGLLYADSRSYRYVISAVLGLHRELFHELGGFSPAFTGYGGEDWELANRVWTAGGVLAHVPDAIAWHHGPDWAGREGSEPGAKNHETLALARLLPDPVSRGAGQWLPYPSIVITMPGTDPAGVLATARTAFAAGADCGLWLTGTAAAETARLLADPRIAAGPPDPEVLSRAQILVSLDGPARLGDLSRLAAQASTTGRLRAPAATITALRSVRRVDRWAAALGEPRDLWCAGLFGGRDVVEPTPMHEVDLAHELKYARGPS